MPTGITDFSRHRFHLQNLANFVTFAERNFIKKARNLTKHLSPSSLTMTSEDFLSEFYYPDEK